MGNAPTPIIVCFANDREAREGGGSSRCGGTADGMAPVALAPPGESTVGGVAIDADDMVATGKLAGASVGPGIPIIVAFILAGRRGSGAATGATTGAATGTGAAAGAGAVGAKACPDETAVVAAPAGTTGAGVSTVPHEPQNRGSPEN
ncbi:MAG: hypothetical protein U0165_00365 [Polyangiaceae bacterium]